MGEFNWVNIILCLFCILQLGNQKSADICKKTEQIYYDIKKNGKQGQILEYTHPDRIYCYGHDLLVNSKHKLSYLDPYCQSSRETQSR
jgi:hypothetical protein